MITVVIGKEIEKIKGEFESIINGMNMVGEIPYNVYSELFDIGAECIQKAYELGKSELEAGKTKWHDLRKDPKDLPPVGMSVLISGYLGDMKGLIGFDDWDGAEWTNTEMPELVRVAWCEIPTFEEEDNV